MVFDSNWSTDLTVVGNPGCPEMEDDPVSILFDKVRELGLETDQYVVIAGSVLVAVGLLEWDEDIDMAVSPEVFERFKKEGWKQDTWNDKQVLKHDIYDIGVGSGEWGLEELQADAMWIEGIPFMSLEKLMIRKKLQARPKDLRHVELIEAYLAKQK